MRFSVIVPMHNSAEFCRKLLESIRQQTFTDYELICVCDACDDDTLFVASAYTTNTFKTDFGNDGLARSYGLDKAQGEYIIFADDDDWFLHEYVFQQLADKLEAVGNPDILRFSLIFKHWKYAKAGDWVAVWSKVWKRESIGATRFPNVVKTSDSYFHKEMMRKRLNIYDWDMPMYYYNYGRTGAQNERKDLED